MSLFGYYNNNNASVSFDRFCSVVRGRADLTPEYAVPMAGIYNHRYINTYINVL